MATEKDISVIVTMLSAAYPNWNVTPYTVEVYYQDLKDIPSNELQIAAQHCRSEAGRKFAPSVGELRGAVMELRRSSLNIPSSYSAWEEVRVQIIENGGDFGKPAWSHPLIERAVKSIGWRELRMSENQTADRARFIQAYEQITERAEKENMLIPEVRQHLLNNGAKLLTVSESIKQLTKGMEPK
jgi:hypothetical protein